MGFRRKQIQDLGFGVKKTLHKVDDKKTRTKQKKKAETKGSKSILIQLLNLT